MKRKSHGLFLVSLFVAGVIFVAFLSAKNADKKGFALIELYTSEGCSSCPPADALVAKTMAENKGKAIFLLAYHVDYWNRLGWKDQYSRHEFSERQRKYDSLLHSQVYTPQIVVNGQTAFVGSDRNRLQKALSKYQAQKAQDDLSISADFLPQKELLVHYKMASDPTVKLQLALIEKNAITDVKNGENAGRTLLHINIVTALKTIENPDKSGAVKIPLTKKNGYMLTSFLENKQTGAITAIRQIDLADLTASVK